MKLKLTFLHVDSPRRDVGCRSTISKAVSENDAWTFRNDDKMKEPDVERFSTFKEPGGEEPKSDVSASP